MKYRLNTTNYWDFNTVEVNKLPGRSYFIPYPDRKKADAVSPKEKRYASEKVLCLNGDWDFKFYPRPAELPTEFDTDAVSFDTIDVPSCWQFRGYDRPFYVNIRYQFPFDPPHIPKTEKVGKLFYILGADKGIGPRTVDPGEEYNFVGVYRRSITIEDPDKNYVISFLGVASCLDLYLNGKFVGYSEARTTPPSSTSPANWRRARTSCWLSSTAGATARTSRTRTCSATTASSAMYCSASMSPRTSRTSTPSRRRPGTSTP